MYPNAGGGPVNSPTGGNRWFGIVEIVGTALALSALRLKGGGAVNEGPILFLRPRGDDIVAALL